jgi:hypothetical protein
VLETLLIKIITLRVLLKAVTILLKFDSQTLVLYRILIGKDKAIPLQAWTGPKVSRKLRLPDFMTIGTLR